jgi:hypothetical protein
MKNTLTVKIKIAGLKMLMHALLLAVLFFSCDDDDIENLSIWTPILKVEKGNGEATLFLVDPRLLSLYAGPVPSNPDYFNLLISEDLENFTFHSQVDVTSNSVKIENLTNGKPYYFVVTSHKEKGPAIPSDTIMTIPAEKLEQEIYLMVTDLSVSHASTSFDFSYTAFVHQDNLYLKPEGGTPGIVEDYGSGSSWSPSTNTLAYMKSIQVGNTRYPFALKLFDAQTGISTEVLEVPYNDYYVSSPTFTPAGEIAFLSSENNSAKEIYDLWKISLETKEKTVLSDFESLGFNVNYNYGWSSAGDEVYLGGWYNTSYVHGIYRFNLSTKLLTPIIQSDWYDRAPSLSPDETKIAFISSRSGEDELWIYDLTNSKFIQVTGEASYHFDSRYTNLQWLSNDEMLITIFEDSTSLAVKIRVN